MKKFLTLITLLIITTFITTTAQPFKIALFTGYGQSAFENQQSAAGMVPLGLQAYYTYDKLKFGSINGGLEFNYAVVPFTYEVMQNNVKVSDQKVNQMIIAALIKVKFLKNMWNPFVRLGAGMYMGDITLDWTDAAKQAAQAAGQTLPDEVKIKSGFGFNIGAGVDYNVSKTGAIFLEFVYHLVSRTADVQGAQSAGRNNWGVQVGYTVGLGK